MHGTAVTHVVQFVAETTRFHCEVHCRRVEGLYKAFVVVESERLGVVQEPIMYQGVPRAKIKVI